MRVVQLKSVSISEIINRNNQNLVQKIVSDIKLKPKFIPKKTTVHDAAYNVAWENLKV
jgi:hypothetical protein